MYNLHPPLTVFPSALICVVVLLEAFSLYRPSPVLRFTIRINLFFAVLGVAAAFFSGYQASELADQTFKISNDVIERHHLTGRALLFCIIPCAVLEYLCGTAMHLKRTFTAAYYVLLLMCLALVVYTSFLGGDLVFSYGAGVRAVP